MNTTIINNGIFTVRKREYILKTGNKRANEIAEETMLEVYEKIGISYFK